MSPFQIFAGLFMITLCIEYDTQDMQRLNVLRVFLNNALTYAFCLNEVPGVKSADGVSNIFHKKKKSNQFSGRIF